MLLAKSVPGVYILLLQNINRIVASCVDGFFASIYLNNLFCSDACCFRCDVGVYEGIKTNFVCDLAADQIEAIPLRNVSTNTPTHGTYVAAPGHGSETTDNVVLL